MEARAILPQTHLAAERDSSAWSANGGNPRAAQTSAISHYIFFYRMQHLFLIPLCVFVMAVQDNIFLKEVLI
jgi:hypothetical protein